MPFGAPGAPGAELADAVAASCAIPGFYRSVAIGDRRYVDGGVHSTSNLDVLAGAGLDLVICLNPTSSLHAAAPRTLGERLAFSLRQGAGRRLGAETARVRRAGAEVVLIQPTVHDLDAMGTNLITAAAGTPSSRPRCAASPSTCATPRWGSACSDCRRASPSSSPARPGVPVDWPDLESAAQRRGERVAGRPDQRPLAA